MASKFLRALVAATVLLSLASGGTGPALGWGPSLYSDLVVDTLEVNVTIRDHYALTQIRQVVRNAGQTSEIFLASLASSELAFITRFAVEVNGTLWEAKVHNASKSSDAFNQSAAAGLTAALIETRDAKVTRVSLSVPANSTMTVYLAYQEMIHRQRGAYSYRLPLDDLLAGWRTTVVTIAGSVEGLNPIVSCAATLGNCTRISETSVEPDFSDFLFSAKGAYFLNWTEEAPSGAGTILTHTGADGTVYFIHVFSADGAGLAERPVPKDIVFVIDNSGSMSGPKIRQAREAFKGICADLREGDRFTVIAFDNQLMYWNETLQNVSNATIADAGVWIDQLMGRASTDINSGLLAGAAVFETEGNTPILVFLSDGQATSGVTDSSLIRSNFQRGNAAGASAYTLAFGADADWTLMQQVAFENGGEARRIYEGTDATEQIRGFYDTFSSPALSGITVDYGEGLTWVSATSFANAFAGSDLTAVGTFAAGTGDVSVRVSGNASGGPVQINGTYAVADTERGSFVERAWAFERLQALLKLDLLGNTTARGEAVELALKYGFVTRYTSLVVAETGSYGRVGDVAVHTAGMLDADSGTWSFVATTSHTASSAVPPPASVPSAGPAAPVGTPVTIVESLQPSSPANQGPGPTVRVQAPPAPSAAAAAGASLSLAAALMFASAAACGFTAGVWRRSRGR